MEQYDVIIVGAGPVGLMCAIECKKQGLSHLILEKGVLTNSIYNFPTDMTFFSTSKKLEIGNIPFISHTDKPTRKEALEYYRRVYDSWGLNAKFYHPVNDIDKMDSGYTIQSKGQTYYSKKIILNTGFYDIPRLMNIEGENLPKVLHYYTDVHPFIDQDVVVVGSANSACDVAMELYHKGANVTMVVRQSALNERVKYWIKPNIENRIREGSIKVYFNSTVTKIMGNEILISTPDGLHALKNNYVLAMTGYLPDFSFLKRLGIELLDDGHQTPKHNEDTLETNVDGIYIAGVIIAGEYTSKVFIENSMDHAIKITNHIKSII